MKKQRNILISIAILAMVVLLVFSISSVFLSTDSYLETKDSWSWFFQADTWTDVTFTSEQLFCVGSDAPEDIFAGAVNLGYYVIVWQEQGGEIVSWSSTMDPMYVTLHHILPGVPCNINIDHDYTLIIDKCPDIDITYTMTV